MKKEDYWVKESFKGHNEEVRRRIQIKKTGFE